ncbi:MAG: dihydropteroate synthase, partial [Planctomycetaceae bacterium]
MTQLPVMMGIVNTTPDSFSDGGEFLDPRRAVAHACELVAQGAQLIDLGAESTRPGATPVSEVEELRRLLPVLEALLPEIPVPISIDTTKAAIADAALRLGAHIINDISGLTFDPRMVEVCARHQAGVICMHIQGTPQSMQLNPTYADVVSEVCDWLAARLDQLAREGVPPQAVVLDPGLGFGKTAEHNLLLLRGIPQLRRLGRPLCIGHSRKRFLHRFRHRPVDERL